MRVWGVGARSRARVVLALFGVWGSVGLTVGLASSAQGAELTPAQTVALRFPAAWGAALPSKNPPVAARGAAAQLSASDVFNPHPTYLPRPAQSEGLPQAAMAYSDPATESGSRRPGYQLASATSTPERRATEPQRPVTPRGAVLNEAQIASIKDRLNLTTSQERMWPAVEAALRALVYKKTAAAATKTAQGARAPALDPTSVEVERLKTAAVPLVMSFNSEQRGELRTLAHLIGLGSLAAQF